MKNNIIRLNESSLRRIVRECVKRGLYGSVLSETRHRRIFKRGHGEKGLFKKDVSHTFNFLKNIGGGKFGLTRADQRKLGMLYSQAIIEDDDELSNRIWDYALRKEREYAYNLVGDSDIDEYEKACNYMYAAFKQGRAENEESDIYTDDDPQFN